MKRRTFVIEISDGEPALPIVVAPPGSALDELPFEAVVIDARERGFVVRGADDRAGGIAIEDGGLVRAGWRLRGEEARNGRLATLTTGSDWGEPELHISGPKDSLPQCVRLSLRDGSSLAIGRSASHCDVIVDDDSVSRRHARFFVQHGVVHVEDLGSSWGTYVDDARIAGPTPLAERAQVRIGHTRIEYISLLDAVQKLAQPRATPPTPEPETQPSAPRWRRFVSLTSARARVARLDPSWIPALAGIGVLIGLLVYLVSWLGPGSTS